MPVDISYFELPLCTDRDTCKVEMVSWPFVLPSNTVTLLNLENILFSNMLLAVAGFLGIMFWNYKRYVPKHYSPPLSWIEVRAMIDQGYLALLAPDLAGLEGFWQKLLLDFPDHPAHGHESRAIPLTLYGSFAKTNKCHSRRFCFWGRWILGVRPPLSVHATVVWKPIAYQPRRWGICPWLQLDDVPLPTWFVTSSEEQCLQ